MMCYFPSFKLQAFLVSLFVLFFSSAQLVAAQTTTCDGSSGGGTGVLTRTDALGSITFTVNIACKGITLDGCTADDVAFPAISNIDIIIKNLGCSAATSPGSCVTFQSTVTGGSISVEGLTRTISTAASAGEYTVARFNGQVSGVSGISIKGIVLTLDSLSTAGTTRVYPVYASSTVAGDSSAGSAFNISDCEVTSGSSLTTSGGAAQMWLSYLPNLISGFEIFEMSGNKVDGVSVTGSGAAELFLVYSRGGLSLTGRNSAIIMRSNSMRGSSAVSSGTGYAQLILLFAPFEAGKNIDGVSSIIIDGADMRDCTVTAAAGEYARLFVLAFFPDSTLTMVNDGKISINNAWIGGAMTYDRMHTKGYGAKILPLYSSTVSGIKEISATNCLIDMNKNNGLRATGASVVASAKVCHLNVALIGLTSITATNCSIRGNYSSATSTVDLYILYTLKALTAGTVSATDSEVATSTPVIEYGPVGFTGTVSDSNVIVKNLGCGDAAKLNAASRVSTCVFFASRITGVSIDIDGLRRTFSGSTAGIYNMVSFNSPVNSATGISIKGIVLTLDSISTAGNTEVFLVRATSTVKGNSSAAGSSFNVSDCEITAGSSVTTSGGRGGLYLLRTVGAVSGFEIFEASGNKMAGVSMTAAGSVAVLVVNFESGITMTGTGTAAIIFRSNIVKGSSAVSTSSGSAQLFLLYGPLDQYENGENIDGASSIIVDGADMRDCTVTAASEQWARLMVLAFWSTPRLTLANSGKISINNAWIGGELTYSDTNAEGYGAKILNIYSRSSGIKEIIATNSFIDMGKNNGLRASGSGIAVISRVLDLNIALSGLTSITARNCVIRGKYSSATTFVHLHILYAAKTLASPTAFTLTDNAIDATSAVAGRQIQAFIGYFKGSVTGAAGNSDTFDVSGSVVRGDYTSSGSYVCAGIAVFDSTSDVLTGFEVIDRNAGVDINAQEASPFGGTHGSDSMIVRCGNNVTTTSTTTTGQPTTTTTSSSTSTTVTSSSSSASEEGSASDSTRSIDTTFTEMNLTTITNTSSSTSSEMNLTTLTNTSSSTSTGAETSTTTTEQSTSTTTTTTTNTTAPNATTNASSREALKTEMEARPDPVIPVAATIGSTSLSLFAAAGPILTVRALAASASLVGCSSATDRSDAALALNFSSPPPPELGPDSNLFGLRVGDERIATYGGAVTTALIILVSVFICGYIFAFGRARFQDLSMSEAARKCHIPSHMVIALAIVAPPLTQASVVLVSHSYSNLAWLGGTGLVVALLPVGLLLLLHHKFSRSGQTLLNLDPKNSSQQQQQQSQQQQEQNSIDGLSSMMMSLIDFLTAPRQEYRKTDLVDRMLFFVEDHVSVKYAACDYAAAIVIASAAGASSCCKTHLCCQLSSYSTAVVAIAWFVVLVARKPLLVRFDALSIPISYCLVSATAILAIVASHSSASSVTEPMQITANVSFYVGITSLVVAAFANMLPSLLYVYSRCCKSAVWENIRKRHKLKVKLANQLQKREEREQRRRENGEDGANSSSSSSSSSSTSSDDDDYQERTRERRSGGRDLDAPLINTAPSSRSQRASPPPSAAAAAVAATDRRAAAGRQMMPAAAAMPSSAVAPAASRRPPAAAAVQPRTNLTQMMGGGESGSRRHAATNAPAATFRNMNNDAEEGEEMRAMLPHSPRQREPQQQPRPTANDASPSRPPPQQKQQQQQQRQQSPRREQGRRDSAAPVLTSSSTSPPSPKPASPRGPYMQAAIDQGKISDPVLLNKVLDELQEQNPAAMHALRAAVTSGAAAAAAAAAATTSPSSSSRRAALDQAEAAAASPSSTRRQDRRGSTTAAAGATERRSGDRDHSSGGAGETDQNRQQHQQKQQSNSSPRGAESKTRGGNRPPPQQQPSHSSSRRRVNDDDDDGDYHHRASNSRYSPRGDGGGDQHHHGAHGRSSSGNRRRDTRRHFGFLITEEKK